MSRISLKISIIYVLIGIAWIIGSDKFLVYLKFNDTLLTFFQTTKGIFFVLATGITLYFLTHSLFKELEVSEEKYKNLFENIPLPMWVFDSETYKFLNVNDAALESYGYSREEFLAMTIKDIRPVEDIQMLINDINQNKNTSIQNTGYWRHKRKDGSLIDVEITASPIIFFNRNARLILVNDVSQRKAAEVQLRASLKEKEIMLKEIHHRVKNNLQVITSLLNLQSNYNNEEVKKILLEAQNRIKSMAIIHEILYETKNFVNINFIDYINKFLTHLFNSYQHDSQFISFELDIDDILLKLDLAIPCGLIINELASNSLKYAFNQNKQGIISISLKKIENNFLELIVSDNGVGLPENLDLKQLKSLGLQLVQSLIEQIDGKYEIINNNGTTFKIRFSQ